MKISKLILAATAASAIAPLTAFAQCDEFTSTLDAHVSSDRAVKETIFYTSTYKAKGSLETLGYFGSSTATVYTMDGETFNKGNCPEATNNAPEIIEYVYSEIVKDDKLIVQGTATDVDGDLSHVAVGNPAIGFPCPGYYEQADQYAFECVVDVANLDKYVEHPWVLVAFDEADNMSVREEVNFTIIDSSQNHAPEIVSYEYNEVVTDGILKVTGEVTDLDGNIEKVLAGNPMSPGTECEMTGPIYFECNLDVSDLVDGESYSWVVAAFDTEGEMSPAKMLDFTIAAQSCFEATNQDHIDAGRAELKYVSLVYAKGSNNYLGLVSNTTALEQTAEGEWTKVTSCN